LGTFLQKVCGVARADANRGAAATRSSTPARRCLALAAGIALLALGTRAQVPVTPLILNQRPFLYNTNASIPPLYGPMINWLSGNGLPISSVTNAAAGSNGRAPTVAAQLAFGGSTNLSLYPTNPPTAGQYKGFVPLSGVAAQASTNLTPGLTFAQNARNIGWPVANLANGSPGVILRAAQVGAPYINIQSSYPFGSVIAPPLVSETGAPLTNGLNLSYWQSAPFGWQNTNSTYYSTNANAVFATQPGQVTVVWQKAVSSSAAPGNLPSGYGFWSNSYSYYVLSTNSYLVSTAPVQPPQQMYWTEGLYTQSGYPVIVPQGSVSAVNIIYGNPSNGGFPQYVLPGDTNGVITNINTLWFDSSLQELRADNAVGQVFVELLGSPLPGGGRVFLGFEIVNVNVAPSPTDIQVELGTRINAYQNGADDSTLAIAPLSGTSKFYYQQALPNGLKNLFATTLTINMNDFQAYWLVSGVAGLQWPFLFNRYHSYWPTAPSQYVNYARPSVTNASQAALTAVQLPASEAPSIAYQDSDSSYPARASISPSGMFYTYVDAAHPAHRALLQFLSGNNVFYERVFSWLDSALDNNALLANSVATNLTAWSTNLTLNFTNVSTTPYLPYVVSNTVYVANRIMAPAGELGSTNGSSYLAGSIVQSVGNCYNPLAYVDPFASGFTSANLGAIIPVNAMPGNNTLEVMWFRADNANTALGFQPSYWPAVIGYYNVQWPPPSQEIILASNAGSKSLTGLGYPGASLYVQNQPGLPGYNPNEEHAMILADTAYALRDDLNDTNTTSAPYVLIDYLNTDGRPSMAAFHVRREAPEQGILFDYVVNAGTILQAPMPLPLLAPPVVGSGSAAVNFNTAPPGTSGDLPSNWVNNTNPAIAYYGGFTYQDRNHSFWVYRGQNEGLPAMQVGDYNPNNGTFGTLPPGTAVAGTPFNYYLHVSRPLAGLTITATLPNGGGLPTNGLAITANTTNGLSISGMPNNPGSNYFTITVTDTDGSSGSANLALTILTNGSPATSVVALGPLSITSTNQYSGASVTFSNRPPFLAAPPTTNNCFTMRFYYVNVPAFDWPGVPTPPTNGAIVPYLLPRNGAGSGFVGNPTNGSSPSLDIVYRPVWPSIVNGKPVPTLYSGQTLTTPINNLPAIRGQGSVQVLYQQSIATNDINQPAVFGSVTLFDPTVEKKTYLGSYGLAGLPPSVVTSSYEGLTYFPSLPPNLANRVWFDPSGTNLILEGEFVAPGVGDNYLFLNVLNGADMAAVVGLCDTNDTVNFPLWAHAVTNLSVSLYTFGEALDSKSDPIPGTYVVETNATVVDSASQLVAVSNTEQAVDSYALGTTGPGLGYISWIVGNSINPQFSGNPVTVYVARVGEYPSVGGPPGLYPGEVVVIPDANPLSQYSTFQHTLDLGGKTANYQYDWRIIPPVNGLSPGNATTNWPVLASGTDLAHITFGGAGIQALADNYVALRYREVDAAAAPANTNWSAFTTPAFVPGYIKRVLEGINPFEQSTSDLFNNPVNTSGTIIQEAGAAWQGDVALNANSLTNVGLIALYETVLDTGKQLSINAGINFGPANDALLLAAGEISDLYNYVASDAAANAGNPTISIGTDNTTYGDVATSLFCFQGEEPSLLEQELALLRGRDDSVTTVTGAPVYNRLYWNYTDGIADGEVIYALNYNIQDENGDGKIDAADAAVLYPMGHGDAYGHYLTAMGNYWSLLLNPNFDWVPQPEAVSILGATVAVNYEHERKFAASAGSLASTGLRVFDLTWREGYVPGTSQGWASFNTPYTNATPRIYEEGTGTNAVVKQVVRYWGLDHWATRVGQGAYLNWVVGNGILPPVDPNPNDQGIQKVDRTTVPELNQLPQTAAQLQTDMNNAEAGFTPFDLAQNAIPFDINPLEVTGPNPLTHFEQIYQRAVVALNNAVTAFNNAEGVTEEMRQQQDSLADFQAGVVSQELAYNNQLIEIYGTPYPDDMGPAGTYPQGYNGPDLIHYTYVDDPNTNLFGGILPNPQVAMTNYVDIQQLPADWSTTMYDNFNSILASTAPGYQNPANNLSVPLVIGPDGFFSKPAGWTSQRSSPGQIQAAISSYLAAMDALRQSELNAVYDKQALDGAMTAFNSLVVGDGTTINDLNNANQGITIGLNTLAAAYNIFNVWNQSAISDSTELANIVVQTIPVNFIAGLADGGDIGAPARGALYAAALVPGDVLSGIGAVVYTADQVATALAQAAQSANSIVIDNTTLDDDIKNAVQTLGQQELALQGDVVTINQNLRTVNDAQAAYQSLVAKGLRIQADRATWRQHAAAIVQGYRTRDAAFRLFQNEDLQRYLTLFNLAGEYAFMAAQAYDYETGLLGTPQGRAFLNQIISAQAIGVVSGGQPQYTSSSDGDPGLAGALAQMKGDWDVLEGRLGFNNPDGYGTTVSLRSENYRVLEGTNGDAAWQGVLQAGLMADVTADSDVRRLCLQIGNGDGSPVPGIVLTFSTTITDGLNLFGNQLSPGDHAFSPSSFATKIFSAGVCLDGYIGMDNPAAGGGVTTDPTTNPNGLAATPYVYLIPCGQDSMRSPPLGDSSTIRSWSVDDVAVPLPFNVSQADFASNPFYTSGSSLSEPLFAVREHQAFRPVSTTSVFNTSIYGADGSLEPSQYTNNRLIGRSIWNSKWKLVIPGKTLLNDPNAGLTRFINSVKDIHLYYITYSYSGN